MGERPFDAGPLGPTCTTLCCLCRWHLFTSGAYPCPTASLVPTHCPCPRLDPRPSWRHPSGFTWLQLLAEALNTIVISLMHVLTLTHLCLKFQQMILRKQLLKLKTKRWLRAFEVWFCRPSWRSINAGGCSLASTPYPPSPTGAPIVPHGSQLFICSLFIHLFVQLFVHSSVHLFLVHQ